MREPKPFFREFNQTWYVQIGKKQLRLGKDEAEAFEKYHELMTNRQELQPHKYVRDLLDEFLAWCKKRRAGKTYTWYQMHLSSFAKSIKAKQLVSQLQPHHVHAWIDKYDQFSDSTKRGAITAIQRAFNWAMKAGHIRRNPIVGIEKPAAEKREVLITDEQYALLLAEAEDQQWKDLLTILWETGCRPQEAWRVTAECFDPQEKRWVFPVVDSKGKKHHRVVYLNEKAMEITKRLCEKNPKGTIFRNSQGRAWKANSVRCRFRRYKTKMEGICAYAFRHTFATRALLSGVDAITVSILLGHVDIVMLSRHYSHLSRNATYLLDQLAKVT